MKREYHKWFNHRLNRAMELLVFGHAGDKVLVFPAREGRFYDYENWGLVDALRHSIDGGHVRLFCVDGIDSESLYCRSMAPPARTARYLQYERYILHEVIPFMLSVNGVPSLIVHGCSIGAYHAINLALRHPALFRKVVALSGRFDLTRPIAHYEDLFSGYYDQDIYFITPNHFAPNLNDSRLLDPMRRLEITLAARGETAPSRSRLCNALNLQSRARQSKRCSRVPPRAASRRRTRSFS